MCLGLPLSLSTLASHRSLYKEGADLPGLRRQRQLAV